MWAGTIFFFFALLKLAQATVRLRSPVLVPLPPCLCKYWSIFLLAGLCLAVLTHPDRKLYFRSAAPWITTAVGTIALTPHVVWLLVHDFSPFRYALTSHELGSLSSSVTVALGYLAGGAGYTAVPTLLVLGFARPNSSVLRDMIAPSRPERRFIAVAFWAPLLLPVPLALAADLELNSTWVMSGLKPLPLVLLGSPSVVLSSLVERAIVATATLLPLIAVLAAPLFAVYVHRNGMYLQLRPTVVFWRSAWTGSGVKHPINH